MPKSCCIAKCDKEYAASRGEKSSMLMVQKDEELRKKWEENIPGSRRLKSSHGICEKHFQKNCIIPKQCLITWRCAAIFYMIALMFVAIIIVIVLTSARYATRPTSPIFPEIPDSLVDGDLLINGVRFVSREEWHAQPSAQPLVKMPLPVKYVFISHTVSDVCHTRNECTEKVRAFQTYHIESKRWSDIAYSFLVGGDGLVYIGRSWDIEGARTPNWNNKSIGISFIGTFNDFIPPKNQLHAAQKLIELGVKEGKIAEDYILLDHRQVANTLSPGDALYSLIQTWPRWSPDPYGKNITSRTNAEDEGRDLLINGVRFVSRKEWHAQPPAQPLEKMTLPVKYVFISHTATDFCHMRPECTEKMRAFQSYHIESKHWSDIAYSFVVGGDGLVYVGRSWENELVHYAFNFNNKSIGISFIGTFNDIIPPKNQIHAAQRLIELGVKEGKIGEDYILLGHRQVAATSSPGDALYSLIQTWPHWSPYPYGKNITTDRSSTTTSD